jgi:chromosome segregation ATPase
VKHFDDAQLESIWQAKDEDATRAHAEALALTEEMTRLQKVVAQKDMEIAKREEDLFQAQKDKEELQEDMQGVVARKDANLAQREAGEAKLRLRLEEMARAVAALEEELRSRDVAIGSLSQEVNGLTAKQAEMKASMHDKDTELRASREELQSMHDAMKAQGERLTSLEATAALSDVETREREAGEAELRAQLRDISREMALKNELLASKAAEAVERDATVQRLNRSLCESQEEAQRMTQELARRLYDVEAEVRSGMLMTAWALNRCVGVPKTVSLSLSLPFSIPPPPFSLHVSHSCNR